LPFSDVHGSSPYDRDHKCSANYGTVEGEVGNANIAILEACNAGLSQSNYVTILKSIKITYAHATMRYAYLMDIDFAEGLSNIDHYRAEVDKFTQGQRSRAKICQCKG
jgi:hypothetical protein